MSIPGLQGSLHTTDPATSIDLTSALAALLHHTQTPSGTATAAADSAGVSGTDTADLSKPAQLFGKLQGLADSDPDRFNQVTAAFAAKLSKLAHKTGEAEGQRLSTLAGKFQAASQTGNVSSLQSPPPARSGVHGAYAQSVSAVLPETNLSLEGGTDTAVSTLFRQFSRELSAA